MESDTIGNKSIIIPRPPHPHPHTPTPTCTHTHTHLFDSLFSIRETGHPQPHTHTHTSITARREATDISFLKQIATKPLSSLPTLLTSDRNRHSLKAPTFLAPPLPPHPTTHPVTFLIWIINPFCYCDSEGAGVDSSPLLFLPHLGLSGDALLFIFHTDMAYFSATV